VLALIANTRALTGFGFEILPERALSQHMAEKCSCIFGIDQLRC